MDLLIRVGFSISWTLLVFLYYVTAFVIAFGIIF